MRLNPTRWIERFRVVSGPMASNSAFGANGAFFIPGPDQKVMLKVIASSGDLTEPGLDFEHVSVSCEARCPTWAEMQHIKEIFWRDDETVMQLHVPKSDHINCHPFCLHMWKPLNCEIPRPAAIAVGPRA
jgi:hypothetical protein